MNNDLLSMKDSLYFLSCNYSKCKRYTDELKIQTDKTTVIKNSIILSYKNKEINKKEFIVKMTKLQKEHFNSNYFKDLASCSLANCYKYCKKVLDTINILCPDSKYKKPSTYEVKDFIELLMRYTKERVIMPIANSQ